MARSWNTCFFLQGHNCVRELRALIDTQQRKIQDFQQEIGEQRSQINELKRELYMMQVATVSVEMIFLICIIL